MIGLGSQYLTAAGFGRYRITAASLGNLDLLGTYWLNLATLQAILGAFGDDGMAVINATNAYIDGIAASDRDKATALAGFINEDPMMVCSLGLEPQLTVLPAMPIRMLDNQGTGYAVFDYVANTNTTIHGKGRIQSSQLWLADSRTGTNNICAVYSGTSIYIGHGGNRAVTSLGYADGTLCEVRMTKSGATVNGTACSVGTGSDYTNSKINNGTYYPSGVLYRSIMAFLEIGEQGTLLQDYLPIKRNGAYEWIDIESGNLATRVGTFTEAFYLPDGTPWTPSTP